MACNCGKKTKSLLAKSTSKITSGSGIMTQSAIEDGEGVVLQYTGVGANVTYYGVFSRTRYTLSSNDIFLASGKDAEAFLEYTYKGKPIFRKIEEKNVNSAFLEQDLLEDLQFNSQNLEEQIVQEEVTTGQILEQIHEIMNESTDTFNEEIPRTDETERHTDIIGAEAQEIPQEEKPKRGRKAKKKDQES